MCKTCDKRLEDLMRLEADRNQEKRRADTLQGMLEERAKVDVHDLMSIASTSTQIAKLSANSFPTVNAIADEAAAVTLGALKLVREHLEEGARDAEVPQEASRD